MSTFEIKSLFTNAVSLAGFLGNPFFFSSIPKKVDSMNSYPLKDKIQFLPKFLEDFSSSNIKISYELIMYVMFLNMSRSLTMELLYYSQQ